MANRLIEVTKRKTIEALAWLQFEIKRQLPMDVFGPNISLRAYDPHKFPISAGYDAIRWYAQHLQEDDIFFNGKSIAGLSVLVMQTLNGVTLFHDPGNYGGARNLDLNELKRYYRDWHGEKEFVTACKVSHAATNIYHAEHPDMPLQSDFHDDAPEALGACVLMYISYSVFPEKSLDTLVNEWAERYFPDKSYGNDEYIRKNMMRILNQVATQRYVSDK